MRAQNTPPRHDGTRFLPHRSIRAFTLVELLMVVAVIAVLAAFLLPALSKAVDSAKQIQCVNNLKQMGTAFMMYADDHAGKGCDTRNSSWPNGRWYYALNPYVNSAAAAARSTGILFTGTGHADKASAMNNVFKCKANSRPYYAEGATSLAVNYLWNLGLTESLGTSTTSGKVGYLRVQDIRHPARTVLAADGNANFEWNRFYNSRIERCHNGGFGNNFLWADSHASAYVLPIPPDSVWMEICRGDL